MFHLVSSFLEEKALGRAVLTSIAGLRSPQPFGLGGLGPRTGGNNGTTWPTLKNFSFYQTDNPAPWVPTEPVCNIVPAWRHFSLRCTGTIMFLWCVGFIDGCLVDRAQGFNQDDSSAVLVEDLAKMASKLAFDFKLHLHV